MAIGNGHEAPWRGQRRSWPSRDTTRVTGHPDRGRAGAARVC